jgi:hypothetical protein
MTTTMLVLLALALVLVDPEDGYAAREITWP